MSIRLVVFLSLLLLFLLLEYLLPRRRPQAPIPGRLCNLGLSLLSSGLSLLLPFSVYLTALEIREQGGGLTSLVDWPSWAEWSLVLVLFDLIVYFQHLMFHAVPLLWHLHKTHHADTCLNVTTAVRFHPIEILLSLVIKMAAVLILGAPAGAVLLFEILLNGCSLFNHTNLYLPLPIDRILRILLVTPDMHRIHHSLFLRETNSNFGFCISFWDRLFGTYRRDPLKGHQTMTLGISCYRKGEEYSFHKSLLMPFDRKGGHYSLKGIGRLPQGGERVSSSKME